MRIHARPRVAELLPMRVIVAIAAFACTAWAQFKSTAPLVVAPTTITDSKGHHVDGLTPDDLILYDNNVPQTIQMDWMAYPIDLVVAVETSSNSGAVIDKLGGSGILFTELLAADAESITQHPPRRGRTVVRSYHALGKIRAELHAGFVVGLTPTPLAKRAGMSSFEQTTAPECPYPNIS